MSWDYEKVYFKGDNFFTELLGALNSSKKSIEIQVYIYEADPLGDRVCRALIEAATRGVKIRMVVDGVGSPDFDARYSQALEKVGVRWMYYHPLPWQRFQNPLNWWKRLTSFWGKFNRRNHCKFFVIDENIAFSGSLNISQRHSEEFSGQQAWQDIGIQVQGEGVRELIDAFEWQFERRRIETTDFDDTHIFLNHTLALRRQLNHVYIHSIRAATKEVTLVTPYFVPPRSLLRALISAADRGVKIRLLTTQKTDVWITRLFARSYYRQLIKKGVEVYEFTRSMLHAKASLIDEDDYIGSTNFNNRSFFHDLEIAFRIEGKATDICLRSGIEDFFKESTQQTLVTLDSISLFQKVVTRAFYFFRYLS